LLSQRGPSRSDTVPSFLLPLIGQAVALQDGGQLLLVDDVSLEEETDSFPSTRAAGHGIEDG